MKEKSIFKLLLIICFVFSSVLNCFSAQLEPSLVSLSSGSLVVIKSNSYDAHWANIYLIDENPFTGWCCAEGEVFDNYLVIELAEETILESLEFDTANVDTGGSAAKDVIVEISDEGPNTGFQEIAHVTLVN